MRLNNFSENLTMKFKQQQNTKESIGLESETQIEPDIKIRFSNQNKQFGPKKKEFCNKDFFNNNQIISQKIKRSEFSIFNVLGVILLKLITQQTIHSGYSRTKLSIIKTINDIELNKIHARYLYLFNIRVTSYQLMAIFNKFLKQIKQQIIKIGLGQKNFKIKSRFQLKIESVKIHNIIMKHVENSSVLSQFFHIFFTGLLLLVKYPIIKIQLIDSNTKQILYILCDYLACKIQEKSSKFIIEQTNFIQMTDFHILFGSLQQNQIKGTQNSDDHLILRNLQSRSTHDLFSTKKVKITKDSHSTGCKSSLKQFSFYSQKKGPKKQILFKNQQIIKSQSKFQINYKQNSRNYSKFQSKINYHNQSSKNISLNSKFQHEKNNRLSIWQTYKRKSINLANPQKVEQLGFKCLKCLMKKQLKFVSKVININLK